MHPPSPPPKPRRARAAGLLLVLAAAGAGAAAPARAEPALVIVLRHAERADEPGSDPGLSAAGQRRAQQLAELLAAAPIDAIVSTPLRRTLDTVKPLAERFGLVPRTVPVQRGAAHIDEVLATVRGLSGRVLVVGHSNTVAAIVAGLSGQPVKPLCETSHALLFVVVPAARANPAALLPLRYGAADPAAAEGCQ